VRYDSAKHRHELIVDGAGYYLGLMRPAGEPTINTPKRGGRREEERRKRGE